MERGDLGEFGRRGRAVSEESGVLGAAGEAAGTVTARGGGKRVSPAWGGGVWGVVETVTSAKPPRGQPLAGGKGKRRKERTAEANGAQLVVGHGGEPKN